MSSKTAVMIGLTIGSVLGGYVPVLWGASPFSYSSVLFSGIGGLIGIYIAYRISSDW